MLLGLIRVVYGHMSAVGANFCSSDIKAFMLGKGTTYSVLLDKGTK